MKKKFAIIFVGVALLLTMTACGTKQSQPFDTVEKFTKAYNELDYNGLMECYDPRIMETVQGIAGGIGSMLGAPDISNSDAANSLVADLLSEYAVDYWDEAGVTCEMTAKEISTELNGDNKAKVTVEFHFTASTGENDTWQETLSMVKNDKEWYITIGLDDIKSLF
jgi:outer membrane lipoprotein-sorting protein